MPNDFQSFNGVIGYAIHPETGKATPVYDYQLEYFNAWQEFHKLLMVKSRKIGATETALRIILYNCFDHWDERGKFYPSRYKGHHVMLVAGNKQSIANKLIRRMKKAIRNGFTDLAGKKWMYADIVKQEASNKLELWNGTTIEAYPASEAARGEENVICVFFTEPASINRKDDSVVYDAIEPNIANIEDADFIMEGTLKGRRGIFFNLMEAAEKEENEYKLLIHDYTRSLGKLLSPAYIERKKKDPSIDFGQEFECKPSSLEGSAFDENDVKGNYKPDNEMDYFTEIR